MGFFCCLRHWELSASDTSLSCAQQPEEDSLSDLTNRLRSRGGSYIFNLTVPFLCSLFAHLFVLLLAEKDKGQERGPEEGPGLTSKL